MSADEDARDNDEPHERRRTLNNGDPIPGKLANESAKPDLDDFGLPAKTVQDGATAQPELDDFGLPMRPKSEDTTEKPQLDDFGLPLKAPREPLREMSDDESAEAEGDTFHDAEDGDSRAEEEDVKTAEDAVSAESTKATAGTASSLAVVAVESKPSDKGQSSSPPHNSAEEPIRKDNDRTVNGLATEATPSAHDAKPAEQGHEVSKEVSLSSPEAEVTDSQRQAETPSTSNQDTVSPTKKKKSRHSAQAVSEWSHQRLAPTGDEDEEDDEEGVDWQAMTALTEYDIYDDDGKLVARGAPAEDGEEAAYGGLGGAGKGYTRVQLDEDAQSATSMDEDTKYLFKESSAAELAGDEDQRDPLSQLEATKDLLTESQRIAYVGVTRLAMYKILQELETTEATKNTKKEFLAAAESMKKWGQKMMVRLYGHMDISSDEQIMIESLAEHGVQAEDLSSPLMAAVKVKNPMAQGSSSPRKSASATAEEVNGEASNSVTSLGSAKSPSSEAPPPYNEKDTDDLPEVRVPEQLPTDEKIDLDLRWTVLCDLFLVLISDSTYDARSRLLLERVAGAMDVSWVQVCRFEKRVIDALEMQEEKDKENWNEEEHMENRRKQGLKRKYMYMGIATAGGALVIGLSAGLLAPMIGAGLAAGFTTIGVTGTGAFLGGVGGAALITSAAMATGGTIAVRASHRRTGAVKTFEYRPLHNNRRLNLILTVSGWMNGKVDDVRLPYSTVDPIMGDIYSLLWEPEMLQSMGETINILATEALTQTVQQVLGSTILIGLMASLQLPIVLTKLSYLIDNPWTVSLDRANLAGLILADSLIDRHLGNRPITLVGFSLGSRVIFSCLKELANRQAYGLVQNAYLFGSPVVAKKEEWLRARTVVSGRFVNGYASNDWILGYLFRATSGGIMRVAGLAPVEEVPGLENLNVTELVNGHMAYRSAMPKLLREVGWEVESDEFTEIEDPDPENHTKRQRELIREIDEARKEADAKSGKRRFGGLFSRGKFGGKKGWETYNKDDKDSDERTSTDSAWNGNVLFDIEAIKAELHSEMIEVRELDSTLPPMRLDLDGAGPSSPGGTADPRSNLRQTQSSDASLKTEERDERPALSKTLSNMFSGRITSPRISSPLDGAAEAENEFGFDTSFDEPRELKSTAPPLIVRSIKPRDVTPERPALKSSATMPSGIVPTLPTSTTTPSGPLPTLPTTATISSDILPTLPTSLGEVSLEGNAWADEEEEFGKEKEMQMTFE